jgi:hypothetical protein
LIGFLALSVLASVGIALADDSAPSEDQPGQADEAGPGPAPVIDASNPKLDGVLNSAARVAASSGDDAALADAGSAGVAVVSGTLRVVVESTAPDTTAARAVVEAAGGTVEAEYADTIQALLAPSAIETVAASPDVRFVRMPAIGVPNAGPSVRSGHSP